jgi:hypothetical protein
MDQLKKFLRQAIKYRFWIAVGISALLPVIAYAVGSGPIQMKAADETRKIKAADSEVKKYTSGVVKNAQWKPAVDEKREELSKDVNSSWKKLYARQAPLLTWPSNVEERFKRWGRKWPEDVDASAVQEAIIEYVNAYSKFVTQAYQTFHPFDPIEGTGIVAAPTQELLLRPASFTVEAPPELGKVWAAQERLWIQRTLLQVIAEVNKNASSWDSAYVKQIDLLEVGSPLAQDQVSMVHRGTLEEAPAITNPAAPPPNTSTTPTSINPMMAGSSGLPGANTNTLYYIKTDSAQYKVLPFEMTVLVEQDHIPDLLVALENSPMAIQVNDFEMAKPAQRVIKPQKGENPLFGMYAMGSRSESMNYQIMMSRPPAAAGQTTFGGMGYSQVMQYGASGGMTTPERKGVNVRDRDRAKTREEEEKAASKRAVVTIHDPYFNVVQVTAYGQARFYNPPPEEPAPEPSPSQAPVPAEGTPASETPKPAETPAAEEAKTETPNAEPEKAKAEEPMPKEKTPKAKDEAKK